MLSCLSVTSFNPLNVTDFDGSVFAWHLSIFLICEADVSWLNRLILLKMNNYSEIPANFHTEHKYNRSNIIFFCVEKIFFALLARIISSVLFLTSSGWFLFCSLVPERVAWKVFNIKKRKHRLSIRLIGQGKQNGCKNCEINRSKSAFYKRIFGR